MTIYKTIVAVDGIAFDDMLGEVRSSITGATSWNTAQIQER